MPDVILGVCWCEGCSFHMYASIKSVALRVCLCKDCRFHMHASIKFQLSGYAPIRLVCFSNRRHFEGTLVKSCRFHMYASMKSPFVMVCSYKARMLL